MKRTLVIEIDMSGKAFAGNEAMEVANTLVDLAKNIADEQNVRPRVNIRDSNLEICGTAKVLESGLLGELQGNSATGITWKE